MGEVGEGQRRPRSWKAKVLLALAATAAGLLVGEGALRLLGFEPRVVHITRRSAEIVRPPKEGRPPLYRPNASFYEEWPSDPDKYFNDPRNRIVYRTNNAGFRGEDFSLVRDDRVRIAFLGDSFCWGHGVKDPDVFTVKVEEALRRSELFGGRFEVYNFGMGGYNTTMEVALLEQVAVDYRPDVCVIWYFLNDATPESDLGTRRYLGGDDLFRSLRKHSLLLDLALAPIDARINAPRLTAYYVNAYQDGSPGLDAAAAALARFGQVCRDRGILPVLAVHPILVQLDAEYPFRFAHEKILVLARQNGITAVDLLPYFLGRDGRTLWVHPSDQHPNHLAHQIAADNFSRDLLQIMSANADAILRSRDRKRSGP